MAESRHRTDHPSPKKRQYLRNQRPAIALSYNRFLMLYFFD